MNFAITYTAYYYIYGRENRWVVKNGQSREEGKIGQKPQLTKREKSKTLSYKDPTRCTQMVINSCL